MPVSFHVLELSDGSLDALLPCRRKLSWYTKMLLFRDVVSGRGDHSYAPSEFPWNLADRDDPTALRRADIYLLGSVLFEIATGLGITAATYQIGVFP